MSDDRMEPLDPELLALADAERQRPAISTEVQDRLLKRLSLAIGGGGGAGGPTGGSTPRGAASRIGHFFGRRVPLGLTAFAIGGLVGAGIHAAITQPAITAPAMPSPPAELKTRPLTAPSVAQSAEEKPIERRAVRTPVAAPAPHESESGAEIDKELAAERALIERAQTATARGDAEAALATLDRSAKQFPSGRLEEERESLRVQCLVKVGRYADARAAGERFLKKFPASMMIGVVSSALDTIP
jgi:hypothetical protein